MTYICVRARRAASTEQEGFEPPVPFGTVVFKTTALSRSATAPGRTSVALVSRRGLPATFEPPFYASAGGLQAIAAVSEQGSAEILALPRKSPDGVKRCGPVKRLSQ